MSGITLEDLAGRTLRIHKEESEEHIVIGALDLSTGEVFILKSEDKVYDRQIRKGKGT